MFWHKTTPTPPVVSPVVASYDASSLEKGTDRRSSFSSANSSSQNSSSQSSPVKSFPTLPQHPAAAYAIPQRHSQYDNEHSSAGTESFHVLPTGGHGSRRVTSKFLRRYWFIVAISLFATLAVIGAIAALMAKAKANQKQWYISADQATQTTLNLSEYWIISGDSIIAYTNTALVGPTSTPTPIPSPAPTVS